MCQVYHCSYRSKSLDILVPTYCQSHTSRTCIFVDGGWIQSCMDRTHHGKLSRSDFMDIPQPCPYSVLWITLKPSAVLSLEDAQDITPG